MAKNEHRIVDLQKVESFRAQDGFDLCKRRCRIVRNADVTDAPRALQVPERRYLHLPIKKIVDLDEIDPVVLKQLERTIDLVKPRLLSPGPNLGRKKRAGAIPCLREQIVWSRE